MDLSAPLLFRPEAYQKNEDRLHGNVSILTPVSWQIISFMMLLSLIGATIFLSTTSYARVETVKGEVSLDKGVASIVPSRSGIITSIHVSEGETVRRGGILALVRSEEELISGETAPGRISAALERQDALLAAQGDLLLEAADADRARLQAQIDGNRQNVSQIGQQIEDQRDLVTAAESDYQSAIKVAKNGFISKRDLESRQATILMRRQQLSTLAQAQSAKLAEIESLRRSIIQSDRSAQAQLAGARSTRAALMQQRVQADTSRGYAVTSPLSGTVTALTARAGQTANSQQQLMLVVPDKARLRVELFVPSTAIGFVSPGQEVRLSIDAFPYQTFGTVAARVISVSGAPVQRPGANGTATSVYLVTASVAEPWVTAFGRRQSLLPGMALSARIVTEKRSLAKWLLEPLFAVGRR